jgi:hypothetical protein
MASIKTDQNFKYANIILSFICFSEKTSKSTTGQIQKKKKNKLSEIDTISKM